MAKLVWDQVDDRLYKSGLDHGVLYLPNPQGEYDDGVSWNGLISIKENFSDDNTDAHYFDGVKYLDSYNVGDFAATLSAYTYPDAFLEFEGIGNLGAGLYVDDQESKVFGLSYRTLIGSLHQGLDQGYRLHLLYHLTAVPSDLTFQNGSNPSEPVNFEWEITGVPEKAAPYRPTSHVILDSQFIFPETLAAIEDMLYGSDLIRPRLPSLIELISFVQFWDPKMILPMPDTGLSQLVDGSGDLTQAKVPGVYAALPTTRLVEILPKGFYHLEVE